MSDDRRDEDERDEADPPEEKDGLGLTEEFRRIESEIEREVGGPLGSRRAGEEPPEVDPAGGEADPPELTPEEEQDGDADEPVAEDSEADEPATDEPEAEVPAAEEPEAEEPGAEEPEDEDAPDPVDEDATVHTVVRLNPLPARSPASVGSGARPLPAGPVDVPEAKTPALWWRFLTASVIIVATTATAVALNILLFFSDVAADLNTFGDGVERVIDTIEPGAPQTILILGSDKRANTPGDPGRSDTTMLLRVDADKGVLSLFSLPRDLKVNIPGYGVGKLNEAYTIGGVEKTTKTVKELLGIDINHIVNVDFEGFADAVDAIDCVYVDVDRDYFNDNSGLFGEAAYAVIDVNAGYQRLCGQNALDYVRYRHTDTDIVRAARQQDFLSQARRQVPVGEVIPILGGDLGSDLLNIFTEYTSSDISTTQEVIGTLKAFVGVRNVPVKRVSFDGTLEESYVTATPDQIQTAVDQFMGGEDTEGPVENEERKDDSGSKKKKKPAEEKDPTDGASLISTEDASLAIGCDQAIDKFAAFGKTSARRLKFPVYVPTEVVPGSCYSEESRQYEIKDPDEEKNAAYKMVIRYSTSDALPEYYGVQGTTWADPPILEDPSGSLEIGDRTYDLHYDGDRLARVAWHDDENNSYWLSNTLLGTLDESDMLAIAKSVDEANS